MFATAEFAVLRYIFLQYLTNISYKRLMFTVYEIVFALEQWKHNREAYKHSSL